MWPGVTGRDAAKSGRSRADEPASLGPLRSLTANLRRVRGTLVSKGSCAETLGRADIDVVKVARRLREQAYVLRKCVVALLAQVRHSLPFCMYSRSLRHVPFAWHA